MGAAEEVFGLKNMIITGQRTEENDDGTQMLVLSISMKPSNQRTCPYCGSHYVYKGQSRIKRVRDLDAVGKHVTLEIKADSYICKDCNKNFTLGQDIVDPGARITKRLKTERALRSLRQPFEHVGADYLISTTTVSTAFREWVNDQDVSKDDALYAPEVLGIDEAHLAPEGSKGDDGMRGVFIDVKQGKLLDITKDRYKDTVVDWLDKLKEPEKMKAVTMDMWKGYREAVYEVFGDRVLVVVDHYHVIQELMKQFQKCRNNLFANLEEGSLKSFKNYQSLLKMNLEDLSNAQKMELNRLFKAVPGLKEAYALKEAFRSIYRCEKRKDAEDAFEQWCKSIPKEDEYDPFRSVERTVRAWYKEIFNFFDSERVSNAATEALNGVIKKINRQGNGYSYEVLRAKMLYGAERKAYSKEKKKQLTVGTSGESADSHAVHKTVFDFSTGMDMFHYEEVTVDVFGMPISDLAASVDDGSFFAREEPEQKKAEQLSLFGGTDD